MTRPPGIARRNDGQQPSSAARSTVQAVAGGGVSVAARPPGIARRIGELQPSSTPHSSLQAAASGGDDAVVAQLLDSLVSDIMSVDATADSQLQNTSACFNENKTTVSAAQPEPTGIVGQQQPLASAVLLRDTVAGSLDSPSMLPSECHGHNCCVRCRNTLIRLDARNAQILVYTMDILSIVQYRTLR